MTKPDIIGRLAAAALSADDMPTADIEALLREAAEIIRTLRVMVGIREEIEQEAAAEAFAEKKAKGAREH